MKNVEKKYNIIIIGLLIAFLTGILGYFVIFLEKKIRMKRKEGLTNSLSIQETMDINKEIEELGLVPATGFCEKYRSSGKAREEACNKLTKDKCQMTSCCVYSNRQNCVAGSAHGPLFKTKNGIEIKVDNYDHYGKCYGNNCV
jgi:hypothetical protein